MIQTKSTVTEETYLIIIIIKCIKYWNTVFQYSFHTKFKYSKGYRHDWTHSVN